MNSKLTNCHVLFHSSSVSASASGSRGAKLVLFLLPLLFLCLKTQGVIMKKNTNASNSHTNKHSSTFLTRSYQLANNNFALGLQETYIMHNAYRFMPTACQQKMKYNSVEGKTATKQIPHLKALAKKTQKFVIFPENSQLSQFILNQIS